MIKMMAAICRKPGMTHAEYVAYIQHVHGSLSNEEPVTLRRYVQNHVFDAAFGSAAETTHMQTMARDSVTELWWDDADAMRATFAHPHVRTRVGPDGANFSDLPRALSVVTEEVEQPVPHPASTVGAKVLHFLRAATGLPLAQFFERWQAAHAQVLAESPISAALLRRCVHNRQLAEFNPMLAYFGAKDMPIYEGVGSLWFDHTGTVGAFRDYERALLAANEQPGCAFYDPAQSFFLYVTEVPIYQRTNPR